MQLRSSRVVWFLAALLSLAAAAGFADPTEFVSVGLGGLPANGPTLQVAISANGRFVAFASFATNLVLNDTSIFENVFVWDRQTGITERVSLTDLGGDANANCDAPSISGDGNLVAFVSSASNLVAGGSLTGIPQVFVRDRLRTNTILISGRGFGQAGNGFSGSPSVSADGRFVAFSSLATNLVPGDGGFARDIFVADLLTGNLELASVDSQGNQANNDSNFPSISADGRFVAFVSIATNLVPEGTSPFPNIFVHDRLTRVTVLASVSSLGGQENSASGNPAISGNGTVVAFDSTADNLVNKDINGVPDVFAHVLAGGRTERMSVATDGTQGNGQSGVPAINNEGRFVAFQSVSTNLVPEDPSSVQDIFVHDRLTLLTIQISVTPHGNPPNGDSALASISGDGRDVVFVSNASNLVPNDTNFLSDAFVRRWISFADVTPDDFGFLEIEAVAAAGIAFGFADDTYRPSLVVTRDQMAVFVARALAGGDANVPAGPVRPSFPDVPRTYWAFKYIEFAKARGVVGGFPDGTYQPLLQVDRAQMAVFIARAVAGSDAAVPPGPPTPTFPDVPTTFWAYKHIEFCRAQRIVFGFPDGLYHPEVVVTRDQMAVFIARAFNLPLVG